MKKRIIFSFIVIFAVLQSTLLNFISLWNVKPDILLVSAVILGLRFDLKSAVLLSLSAGLLKDLFAAGSFGINTVSFPLLSWLVYSVSKKITLDNFWVCIFSVFLAVILNNIFYGLICSWQHTQIPAMIFLRTTVLESLYTAIVSPIIFKITK